MFNSTPCILELQRSDAAANGSFLNWIAGQRGRAGGWAVGRLGLARGEFALVEKDCYLNCFLVP